MDGVSIMGTDIVLPVGNITIQVLIHQDISGGIDLDETLLPQFTSQSKHYHTKTI